MQVVRENLFSAGKRKVRRVIITVYLWRSLMLPHNGIPCTTTFELPEELTVIQLVRQSVLTESHVPYDSGSWVGGRSIGPSISWKRFCGGKGRVDETGS